MERTAECACGDISITLAAEPELCFACHCDYCQKLTGSLAITGAAFREEDVVSKRGAPTEFDPELPDWPDARRYFCPRCGSTVHWINPTAFPGMRLVSIGCFADPNFPSPAFVNQTQSRHAGCPPLETAHSFERYPPTSDA